MFIPFDILSFILLSSQDKELSCILNMVQDILVASKIITAIKAVAHFGCCP